MGLRKVGFDKERAPVSGYGFIGSTPLPERVAEIIAGLRVVWIESELAVIHRYRFVNLTLSGQRIAKIEMVLQTRRIYADGPANPLHREVMAPDLMCDDAEQVQGVGMVGLRGKDLAVDRLGFRKLPGLVAPNRQIEGLGNRHIADWSKRSD